MTRSELARVLNVAPKDRTFLRKAVLGLEARGKLQRYKKARYGLPTKTDSGGLKTVTGVVRFPSPDKNRNAFLILDEKSRKLVDPSGETERVFVPQKFSNVALPGDRVRATIHQSAAPKWQKHVKRYREKMKRPGEQRAEARVQSIESRQRTKFVGTLRLHKQFAHVEPDDSAVPKKFDVHKTKLPGGAKDGHKVLVKLEKWDSPFEAPKGRVIKILGMEGDAGVDILSIIHRHDLPLEFPDTVVAEAKAVEEKIDSEELEFREDWRDEDVVTIDPFDAKDFDDAICVKRLDSGGWELAVFIADVSHYVRPGSALDKEARRRGNSAYLVDRVIPMLPEELSNGICSLNPHVDRLTHAAILEFDAKGKRTKARFAKTVINSKQRFAYEEAFAILDDPNAVDDHGLRRAWELASRLRELRMENGSLDLDFPEVKVILDETGKPIELRKVQHDTSHQLIEEFMLAANEAVAEFTKNSEAGGIYRIHEDPDVDKLFEFRELARAYKYDVGDLSLRSELQKLLRAIRGKTEEHQLKLGLLKSLKRAAYSEQPIGHYGLAKSNYTHFTSPIRRYADLVVHRVLEKKSTRPTVDFRLPRKTELTEVAEHLSTTERTAASAESESKLLKQFEFFLNIARGEERMEFEAIVTEVMPRGLFVELSDYFLRGMVKAEDLPRREYFFEPAMQRVTDSRGRTVVSAGQCIMVQVRRVDIDRKHLDFVLAKLPG